jgi:uncharacterized membrane protein
MTVILASYFLFQTGIAYETAGVESWSVPLSRYRLGDRLFYDFWYVTGPQVSGAEWLSTNTQKSTLVVYADTSASLNLVAYGGIYTGNVNLRNPNSTIFPSQFVFLSELNTVYNELLWLGRVYNSSTLESQSLNVVYNNGFCEVLG